MADSHEQTDYSFSTPTPLWRTWTASLDGNTTVYERFHELMRLDAADEMPAHPETWAETVPVACEMATEDWQAWRRTVPRDVPLSVRIRTLLRDDVRRNGATDRDVDDGVAAMRIRHRAMRAVQDARAEGADDAAEDLAEIIELAGSILD